MEPRTGKTKTTVDYLSILHKAGKVDRVVILCPLSVIGVWEDEFAAHSPVDFTVVVWDRDGRKEESLPTTPGRLNIVVINYDAFSISDKRSKTGRMWLRDTLRAWGPQAMVLDESHIIKTPSAKKTYAIWSVAWRFGRGRTPKECLVPYRVILTGTPVTKAKRVFDIYSQWKFLNPSRFEDYSTFDEFKNRYGKWTHRNGYPQWLGNRNVKELRRRIERDAHQVRRRDCFDLPPVTHQRVPVQLSQRNWEHYREMERDMLTKLANGEISTASIKLVQTMRLSQITSGLAMTEEDRLYQIGREKLEALRELLEPLHTAEEKVVVAARFKADLQRARKLGREMGFEVYGIYGGIERKQRDENIRAFRRTGKPAMMVIQPQAASLGIDLSSASTMVWLSLTPSFVNFSQACDRIALADRPTHFYHLLVPGTVDYDLFESLRNDRDVAEVMLERLGSSPFPSATPRDTMSDTGT